MSKSKKLHQHIESKLNQLSKLINKITEAQTINSNDPDTWDSDTLYDLVEQCKETIKLLEDQPIKDQYNELGQPLYEDGLCSLVDNYQDEEE